MADISNYYPSKGQLTFENEGNEGGPYHSRTLHVPSDSSGLTIGRGYDMKMKTKVQIKNDLIAAGVIEADAETISGAAGMAGRTAEKFIKDKKLESFEISPDAQLKLFNKEYERIEADTKRLCAKPDVEAKYGACNWQRMDPTIQELLIDLRYRGDYAPHMREQIQKAAVTNNFTALEKVLSNISNFGNIDLHRFNSRKEKIKKAAAYKRVESSKK